MPTYSGYVGFDPGAPVDIQYGSNGSPYATPLSKGSRNTFADWLNERMARLNADYGAGTGSGAVKAAGAAAVNGGGGGGGSSDMVAAAKQAAAVAAGGGGGTGGVGGGGGTGNAADGLAGATGWASTQGFTPAELNTIYDEPWRIIGLTYPGIATGGAGYSALRNIPIDPLELRMMTQGAEGILAGGTPGSTDAEQEYGAADYANFLNDFYTQMGTSGGQGINTAELLNNIFGQVTGEGPADATTSLAQLLSSGDSSTQARVMYNLVKSATEGGMDPLAAQAYQAAFLAALDKYGTMALTTDSADLPSLGDYITQNNTALTSGFR